MKKQETYQMLYDLYSGIICNNKTFYEGKKSIIQYRFDCHEYQELKEKYRLNEIAKAGSDFDKALRLLHHFAPRLSHKGNYDNHIECNALALLDYCYEKNDVGINCLNKSKILEECCLALGIYARRVSIRPYSPYDFDNHVVIEIYDRKLQKWIMLDCSTNGYFIDENKIPLSCMEIREKMGKQELCTIVYPNQSQKNVQKLFEKNLEDNCYYAKNMYYFVIDEVSAFGQVEDYIYLIPKYFDMKQAMIQNMSYKVKYAKKFDFDEKIFLDKIEDIQKQDFKISSVCCLWNSPIE